MPWQHIRVARFGGPEVLELAGEQTVPDPGPGEVRIKVLAAGTGFTDTFIRRGRYPDFKGPLPFTPGYDLVGVVGKTGPGVTARAKASWSPISVSLAATHNMRSARRASSFRSRMGSIPPQRSASR
jgi:NADPH:quinone reductase-like Zn-dependent oxidoreductase